MPNEKQSQRNAAAVVGFKVEIFNWLESKRYGHIGNRAQRRAVDALCEPVSEGDVAQNRARSGTVTESARAN